MPRFFCESLTQDNARFALEARVAQHVRVLRMRAGEPIVLFDGVGGEVPGTICEIGKRDVLVETKTRIAIERELARHITLNIGLIANDRFDWLIQKAVELGVAEIQPLYTERSQRIPGDIEKRVTHWKGVVIAACEQCGRNRLPNVNTPIALQDAIKSAASTYKVIMDTDGATETAPHDPNAAVTVFVGPEGGFSPNELALLRGACDARQKIGETTLRAETAAIAAIVRVNS
jgi:16S rRNA (uracil1498-N3)-methyltransferase